MRLRLNFAIAVLCAAQVSAIDFCLRCNKALYELSECDMLHPEAILVSSDTLFDQADFERTESDYISQYPRILVHPPSPPSSSPQPERHADDRAFAESEIPGLILPAPESSSVPGDARVKRPMNSFFVFKADYVKKHRKRFEGMTASTKSSAAGQAWKALSDAKKLPYIEKAKQIEERFHAENPDYKYSPRPRLTSRKSDSAYVITKAKKVKLESACVTGGDTS
jgi:hypothetical protein